MAKTAFIPVKKLIIDLNNFRTVPQQTEIGGIHALVTIAPEKFWALMDSLLTNGYFLTENILVLQDGTKMHVREGNRRVAAMKIILGEVSVPNLSIPSELEERIAGLSNAWKKDNAEVPCALYDSGEISSAGRIVSLTHGKGEQAGRAQWNAVARARHNRSEGASEAALDMLEKYLSTGTNLSTDERELWAGDYPLTVLQEALQNVGPRLGFTSIRDLSDKYPSIAKHRKVLDSMLCDIGRNTLDFPAIRSSLEDFAEKRYGIQPAMQPLPSPAQGGLTPGQAPSQSTTTAPTTANPGATAAAAALAGAQAPAGAKKPNAVPVSDARAVIRALKQFHPKGKNREKLVTLLDEARGLKLGKHPHSFCFLLRSMFELSAKAYCIDYAGSGGPSAAKQNGEDKHLVDVLRDITGHLTKNKTDKVMLKHLHGAMSELSKPHGFLSVTSMNQLIHSPKFIVDETHISNLFFNIFPLLEGMNK